LRQGARASSLHYSIENMAERFAEGLARCVLPA